MKSRLIVLSRLVVCGVLLLSIRPVTAQTTSIPEVHRYLDNGGVFVTHQGEALYAHRADESFVPASTLKLATALTAIHTLGLDYQYKTEFYVSPDDDLIIRGFGDPFLVSEEWELITGELADTGALPSAIRNLHLDTSAFAPIDIPGLASTLNPYDAANGALAANFNTIHVRVEAGGRVRSAEDQTPLTPLARQLASKLAAGRHRMNISKQTGVPARYAGELAAEFLAREGHPVSGRIVTREVASTDRLIYTHTNSRNLEAIIAAMMKYSNNFVANQLLLAVGLETGGEPVTLAKGVRALETFLSEEVGLDRNDFEVVEGSGISRQNRFTPRALAEVVMAFHPYRHLLTPQGDVLLKTGTLSGVYALAGYLPSEHPLSFVILLSQKRNTRNDVLAVLERQVPRTFEPMLVATE